MKNKIAVYSICKNEEKRALRWLSSVRDADFIIVGDTGSTDHTINILEANGVKVHRIQVNPWRFDIARNKLLDLVPKEAKICMSVDFDEVVSDNGISVIKEKWNENINRMCYKYTEKRDDSSSVGRSILTSKIHSRKGYRWIYPVHETLEYCGKCKEKELYVDDFEILHTPDLTKNRYGYLDLMELAVKEDPSNKRHIHQLGRDYMQYGFYDKCIDTMKSNLKIVSISKEQRLACIRFIARAYGEKNDYNTAKKYLNDGVKEFPDCNSAYIEHVILSYKYSKWDDMIRIAEMSEGVIFHGNSLYNEFYNKMGLFFDLISIAYYHKSEYQKAYDYAEKAIGEEGADDRIRNNLNLYKSLI